MVRYWSASLVENRAQPTIWLLLAGLAAVLVLAGLTDVPFGSTVALIALALPVAWLLINFPEVTLALFVSAGSFKADPRIQSLIGPVDPTLGLAAILLLGIMLRGQINAGRASWTRELLLALLFAALVFSSQVYAPSTDYGPEKALRFTTLTMLAFVAPLLVLSSLARVNRFFMTLVGVGIALALSAVTGAAPEHPFTAFQSAGAISLSRGIGIAVLILLLWLGTLRGPRTWKFLGLGLVGFLLAAQVGTGARGPFFALLGAVGMTALAGFLLSRRRVVMPRGAAFALVILSLLVGVVVAWTSPIVPQESRERIQGFSLFALEEETSSNLRLEVWDEAVQAFEAHPLLGVGVGGLSTSGVGRLLLYPHNIVLEIASEVGLLGLVLFCLLVLAVLFRLVSTLASLRRAAGRGSTVLFITVALIVFGLANAMVSGDLNDARMLWLMFGVALAVVGMLLPSHSVTGSDVAGNALAKEPSV